MGDHAAIQHFLQLLFHAPTLEGFTAALEDPFYEPSDRLVVSCEGNILAHVHLTRRTVHFDGLRLPAAGLGWLATLPEHRGQGWATRLLRLAERHMAADGAVLGLLRTRIPWFFRRAGWAVCGRHCHSAARPREVLAQLSAAGLLGKLRVRPWRQVELPALMRLYALHAARGCGAIDRSEAYWRWLVSRGHYDDLLVAVDGADRGGDLEGSRIRGYLVLQEGRLLELLHDPDWPEAAHELLARAAGEAIERGLPEVTLCAPPDHPLHALLLAAQGSHHHHEVWQGDVLMVRLLDPPRFLAGLRGLLHRRAEAAGLDRPAELGLWVERDKLRLALSRRSVQLARGRLGRSYLRCNPAEFTRLLLGHLDVAEAQSAGRLACSTRLALETARVLFPRRPLWRSPLDEV